MKSYTRRKKQIVKALRQQHIYYEIGYVLNDKSFEDFPRNMDRLKCIMQYSDSDCKDMLVLEHLISQGELWDDDGEYE